jgi:hypothetical protein
MLAVLPVDAAGDDGDDAAVAATEGATVAGAEVGDDGAVEAAGEHAAMSAATPSNARLDLIRLLHLLDGSDRGPFLASRREPSAT